VSQDPEAVRGAFWADEEASLLAPDRAHVIRDSKTPSGEIPISSLRGPIITDALYRTFKKHGLNVRYVFTIDDYDPMDSQSMKAKAGMAEHMGKPFAHIPSPEPSAASDFARYHASAYLETFETLGIRPEEIHWMRDLYGKGELDTQSSFRRIAQQLSDSEIEGRGLLPLVDEPVHLDQFRCVLPRGREERERSPSVDCLELCPVPHQQHFRTAFGRQRGESVQRECAGQGGFVDDHQLTPAEGGPAVVMLVEPLRGVVALHAQVPGEHRGGSGRWSQPDHAVAPVDLRPGECEDTANVSVRHDRQNDRGLRPRSF